MATDNQPNEAASKHPKVNKDGLTPGQPVDTETAMRIERERAAKNSDK